MVKKPPQEETSYVSDDAASGLTGSESGGGSDQSSTDTGNTSSSSAGDTGGESSGGSDAGGSGAQGGGSSSVDTSSGGSDAGGSGAQGGGSSSADTSGGGGTGDPGGSVATSDGSTGTDPLAGAEIVVAQRNGLDPVAPEAGFAGSGTIALTSSSTVSQSDINMFAQGYEQGYNSPTTSIPVPPGPLAQSAIDSFNLGVTNGQAAAKAVRDAADAAIQGPSVDGERPGKVFSDEYKESWYEFLTHRHMPHTEAEEYDPMWLSPPEWATD